MKYEVYSDLKGKWIPLECIAFIFIRKIYDEMVFDEMEEEIYSYESTPDDEVFERIVVYERNERGWLYEMAGEEYFKLPDDYAYYDVRNYIIKHIKVTEDNGKIIYMGENIREEVE